MKKSEEKKNVSNRKGWSILGFLISIILLTIAIILSMNEEKATREAKINEKQINSEVMERIEQASSEMSKTVNEVQSGNKIQNSNTLNELDDKNTVNNVSEKENQNEINEEGRQNGENSQTNQSNGTGQINQNNDNRQTSQNNENQQTNQSNENSQTTQNNTSNEQFIKPVEGEISSSYSIDNLQYSNTLQEWITHRGIDIKADKTTVVKASKSGTVKYIKEDPRYGLSITIEHSDGFQTVYSSLLSAEFVKEGDKVEQGQSIGTVGNSAVFESAEGSHLHFEILKDGEYVNPDIYLK